MRDRLIELISQVQYMSGLEGRLADHLLSEGVIVPPCKMNQKVYVADNGGIREATVYEMYLRFNNDTEILLSFDCDLDCEKCPFSSWSQDPSGEYSCGGEYGCWGVKFEDFGKIVFLTREEAEKALAERSRKWNVTRL